MSRFRRNLTEDWKDVVLKLIQETFSHVEVIKCVGVSRSCIPKFL